MWALFLWKRVGKGERIAEGLATKNRSLADSQASRDEEARINLSEDPGRDSSGSFANARIMSVAQRQGGAGRPQSGEVRCTVREQN